MEPHPGIGRSWRTWLAAHLSAPWLRPFRHAGILLFGKGVEALLSLVGLAVAARVLGTEEFGILVLLHGLVATVAAVAGFASWQTVVRYGAVALERNDGRLLREIVRFAVVLDLVAAVLGVTLVVALADPAARVFGIPPDMVGLIRLYGLTVALLVGGQASFGVLRLFGRFDLAAVQNTVMAACRALGGVYFWIAGGTLAGFLLLWFLSVVASRIALTIFARTELRRRAPAAARRASLRGALSPVPGIWRFAVGTNLIASLQITGTKIALLMVGWLLGPAAAGLFQVAQRFAGAIVQPVSKQLSPALFPEIAHLTALGDSAARREMVVRPALLAAGFALLACAVIALAGKWLIAVTVGEEFLAAYPVMVLLTIAGLPVAASVSLEPLLISMGKLRLTVLTRIAASAAFIVLLVLLLPRLDLTGAGLATIVYAALTAGVLLALTWKYLRKRSPQARDRRESAGL